MAGPLLVTTSTHPPGKPILATYLHLPDQMAFRPSFVDRDELEIIEARPGAPGLPYVFTLRVTQADPNAPADLDGDGVPDEVPADAAAPQPGEGAA